MKQIPNIIKITVSAAWKAFNQAIKDANKAFKEFNEVYKQLEENGKK